MVFGFLCLGDSLHADLGEWCPCFPWEYVSPSSLSFSLWASKCKGVVSAVLLSLFGVGVLKAGSAGQQICPPCSRERRLRWEPGREVALRPLHITPASFDFSLEWLGNSLGYQSLPPQVIPARVTFPMSLPCENDLILPWALAMFLHTNHEGNHLHLPKVWPK